MTPGPRRWLALAGLLAAAALLVRLVAVRVTRLPDVLDWQPALALHQPWRAFTAAAVHYSTLHLSANLLGAALIAALGVAARIPPAMAAAWAAAWPLTQIGLMLRPDLPHYGGLSGVLHAGAAVVAVHLVAVGPGMRRAIGAALFSGLVVKVAMESPWGSALRHPAGWDIATAPFAHLSGLVAGVVCATVAVAIGGGRHDAGTNIRPDA